VVSLTPQPLYPPGKSPWYPLDRRLDEPQSRSGRGGEEKNSQPPPQIEPYNPDHIYSMNLTTLRKKNLRKEHTLQVFGKSAQEITKYCEDTNIYG
jgi:hypothetical protein